MGGGARDHRVTRGDEGPTSGLDSYSEQMPAPVDDALHIPLSIVYVAWGAHYMELLAKNLAASILPRGEVVVITDETTPTDALPDAVTVVRRTFTTRGLHRKAEALAELSDDYRVVVFLDVDVTVLDDISLGVLKSEIHGVCLVPDPHYSLGSYRGFGGFLEFKGVLDSGQLLYNAGVIFFDWRRPDVREAFALWNKLCQEARDFADDQPFLSLALELQRLHPYVLSPSFNFRSYGGWASVPSSGRVRVWHSHRPVPENVKDLSPRYQYRYEPDVQAFVPTRKLGTSLW